ncbi:MAG: GTPase HflX [Clostridiales bacterium]|jgi:GTP-binding protein HflX|nr:GTPase HflX [Clostridiales bacterium]
MGNGRLSETAAEPESAVLIAVDDGGGTTDACLDELSALAGNIGIEEAGRVTQRREKPHPARYLGKGRLEDLSALVSVTGAGVVIADDELTNAQMRGLAEATGALVIDRSLVILDIFAARASSAEGAAQTELARLKYSLSRLAGLGKSLSRQGGGGGGGMGARRGGGETKLELDRRAVRERIARLTDEIGEIKKRRGVSRDRREKNRVPLVSLCGYTNSGKSTLLNAFTGADALAEDKLFATLDTTTRRVEAHGFEYLMSDTVGFIRKLPHALIDAFSATLEELTFADVLLHVVDASSPDRVAQIQTVKSTLSEIGASAPIVTVFNKMDASPRKPLPFDRDSRAHVEISARTGEGLDALAYIVAETIKSLRRPLRVLIPYAKGDLIGLTRSRCGIVSEQFLENGTLLELLADEEMSGIMSEYIV